MANSATGCAGGGGSSDLVLLQSISTSGVTSVEFTDLTSTYSMYTLVWRANTAIAGSEFIIKTSTDNGSFFDNSNYKYFGVNVEGTSSPSSVTQVSTHVKIAEVPTVNTSAFGTVNIMYPTAVVQTLIISESVSAHATTINTGYKRSVSGGRGTFESVDAFQFSTTTSVMNGVEMRLYGWLDA